MRSLWALGLWSSQANAATYEELMRKPAGVGDVVVIVASMAILFAPMWFGMLKATRRLGWSQGWRNAAFQRLDAAMGQGTFRLSTTREETR